MKEFTYEQFVELTGCTLVTPVYFKESVLPAFKTSKEHYLMFCIKFARIHRDWGLSTIITSGSHAHAVFTYCHNVRRHIQRMMAMVNRNRRIRNKPVRFRKYSEI